MAVAVEVEQVVAGFINTRDDCVKFTLEDVNDYIMSLWNAGCGPIRLNFTQSELYNYLEACRGTCLHKTWPGFKIDKSLLDVGTLTDQEKDFLDNDLRKERAFILFCKLHVSLNTPDRLLDAMGFRFMYTN